MKTTNLNIDANGELYGNVQGKIVYYGNCSEYLHSEYTSLDYLLYESRSGLPN